MLNLIQVKEAFTNKSSGVANLDAIKYPIMIYGSQKYAPAYYQDKIVKQLCFH